MTPHPANSIEDLNQMYADGRLSDSEYETLRTALEEAQERQKAPDSEQSTPKPEGKKLRRSRKHRQLQGVCAGLAEYFDLRPWSVRAVFILFAILSGIMPALLTYIILWLLVPWEDKEPPEGEKISVGRHLIPLAAILGAWLITHILLGNAWGRLIRVYIDLAAEMPRLAQMAISFRDMVSHPVTAFYFLAPVLVVVIGVYLILPADKHMPRALWRHAWLWLVLLVMLWIEIVSLAVALFSLSSMVERI